jgi:L-ascorbate metabolism protein UlaG (beta-lactamase superfamily)
MKLYFIRNATMRITYGGITILTDPYLAAKHAYPALRGRSQNPMVELPIAAQEVAAGIDVVLVSHLHPDHFDAAAQSMIDPATPILCQPADVTRLEEMGYHSLCAVEDREIWQGVTVIRTAGAHGTGEWGDRMGAVAGFVLQADGEPTVYWCGDTIWYEAVQEMIDQYRPDVIITHSGGAEFEDGQPIIMDAAQTLAVCRHAPHAQVIAIHMEVDDHCTVSRADLRAQADQGGINAARLHIPADGEVLAF